MTKVSTSLKSIIVFAVLLCASQSLADELQGAEIIKAPKVPVAKGGPEKAEVKISESLPVAAKTSPSPSSKTPSAKTPSAKTPNAKVSSAKEAEKKSSPVQASAKAPVSTSGNTRPLSDFELGKYQYCGVDKDCVVAVNGCCDCANGSEEVAVNRERLSAFRERFDCLYVSCGLKESDPPCSSGVVSCIEHRCQYFDVERDKESF